MTRRRLKGHLSSNKSPSRTSYTFSRESHTRTSGSLSSSRTTSGRARPPILSPLSLGDPIAESAGDANGVQVRDLLSALGGLSPAARRCGRPMADESSMAACCERARSNSSVLEGTPYLRSTAPRAPERLPRLPVAGVQTPEGHAHAFQSWYVQGETAAARTPVAVLEEMLSASSALEVLLTRLQKRPWRSSARPCRLLSQGLVVRSGGGLTAGERGRWWRRARRGSAARVESFR